VRLRLRRQLDFACARSTLCAWPSCIASSILTAAPAHAPPSLVPGFLLLASGFPRLCRAATLQQCRGIFPRTPACPLAKSSLSRPLPIPAATAGTAGTASNFATRTRFWPPFVRSSRVFGFCLALAPSPFSFFSPSSAESFRPLSLFSLRPAPIDPSVWL
jgi:hypothetical protein